MKRDKVEIYFNILNEIYKNNRLGIIKTKLMVRCNLSSEMINAILPPLVKNGLIEITEDIPRNKIYLTVKGIAFLIEVKNLKTKFKEFKDMIK